MLKDFFQENAELENELRAEQFRTAEYLARGKYRMKTKFFSKGKKHYDFDINSQQYFHEHIDDLPFDSMEVQQAFHSILIDSLHEPPRFRNRLPHTFHNPQQRSPSATRKSLAAHFRVRVKELQYEKYKLLLRVHNGLLEDERKIVDSRLALIDREIQVSLSREVRLSCEDGFEESLSGQKPVPINQSGQPIYKYLEEEECCFSNISRDDILVYARRIVYLRHLHTTYVLPLEHQLKNLVTVKGLSLLAKNQQSLKAKKEESQFQAFQQAKKLIDFSEAMIEKLSPGNILAKEQISTFFYNIFGAETEPLLVPLLPSLDLELLGAYSQALPTFFKDVIPRDAPELSALLPKLNCFNCILFKYQNKEIREKKEEVRVGIDDDINLQKELFTMLQEAWVTRHLNIDFSRYQYRMKVVAVDWPLDAITAQHAREAVHPTAFDSALQQISKMLTLEDYQMFRKHLKRRAESTVTRASSKFFDMQICMHDLQQTTQTHELQQVGSYLRTHLKHQEDPLQVLKPATKAIFQDILKQSYIRNVAEVEAIETLRILGMRETRTKMLGLLNGLRCYHRNLSLDLRVLCEKQFTYRLDDDFLINSSKQTLQNFEKAVKDTQTYFSRTSNGSQKPSPTEAFLIDRSHEQSPLYKRDIPVPNYYQAAIPHVLVKHGCRPKNLIVYEVVLTDLSCLERSIVEIASKTVARYERQIRNQEKQELVDRVQLLEQIYNFELEYLYEKFRLVELYYHAYETTSNPLSAFKISATLVRLIHQRPLLDIERVEFSRCYRASIDKLRNECRIVELFGRKIEDSENEECLNFHRKFLQSRNVPLTLHAYTYGDLENKKKNGSKLQRMNSIASRMSKDSSNRDKKSRMQGGMQEKINEEKQEDSESSEESSFDLQRYDQYLLRKDMDQIFEDMNEAEEGVVRQAPTNAVAMEHIVVNPRYEGGPHMKMINLQTIPTTSLKRIALLDFNDILCYVVNVHEILEDLGKQFAKHYGYISDSYQTNFLGMLSREMVDVCLTPDAPLIPALEFQTEDPYQQTVTRSVKQYEETMALSLESTNAVVPQILLERHQQKLLPSISLLLDYHSLLSLITLQKPLNTFLYKEISLGLNFLELLDIKQALFQLQLQRRSLQQAYLQLAKQADVPTDFFGCLSVGGQNQDPFLATQELRIFNAQSLKYPVLPEAMLELRCFQAFEEADVHLLQTVVDLAKLRLEDVIIMRMQVGNYFHNSRLMRKRIASQDAQNIKNLRNRMNVIVTLRATPVFKEESFLKMKQAMKSIFDLKLKDLETIEQLPDCPPGKVFETAKTLLAVKYRRKMQLKCLESYTEDFRANASRHQVISDTIRTLARLKMFVQALPFMNSLFEIPNIDKDVEENLYFDQLRLNDPMPCREDLFLQGSIEYPFYILPKHQLLGMYSLLPPIAYKTASADLKPRNMSPPLAKDELMRWVYNVPDRGLDAHQNGALKHMLKLVQPFTGLTCVEDYTERQCFPEAPRNKFTAIQEHYESMLEYLEANLLIISLQFEDGILRQFTSLLLGGCNFETTYPARGEDTTKEGLHANPNIPFHTKEHSEDQIQMHIKQEMLEKDYPPKKLHWAIRDQTIDFLVNKIQGNAVIRQAFLPLKDQLAKIKAGGHLKNILDLKSRNILLCIHLGIWETYLAQKNDHLKCDFHQYLPQLASWLTPTPSLNDYRLATGSTHNEHFELQKYIQNDPSEHRGFIELVFDDTNGTIIHKLRHVIASSPNDPSELIQRILCRDINKGSRKAQQFFQEGLKGLRRMGDINRVKLFARIRFAHEQAIQFAGDVIDMQEQQERQHQFLQSMVTRRNLMFGMVSFNTKLRLPVEARRFKNEYQLIEDYNKLNCQAVLTQLDSYVGENRLHFTKSELALIGKPDSNSTHSNSKIQHVLGLKLLTEDIKAHILRESLRILRSEKLPKTEPKKIVNPSLIPRVHLIASYSSPLICERRAYISQQYKLAFVQAFINRFRNKVSRVDLLSSGFGFVITVPDLEDCVNFMNKLLFTFTQKEFRMRIDTFAQYYEILIDALNDRNAQIKEQAVLIDHLIQKNKNMLEAEYLGTVTRLLQQKTTLDDELRQLKSHTQGLQDRVRKTIQVQYDNRIQSLTSENHYLREQFNRFKGLMVVLTKDASRSNFLTLLNSFKDNINDLLGKKIDFSVSFQSGESSQDKKEDREEREDKGGDYTGDDLQRCKIGEALIHDPYYTTKLLNKMRIFNLLKLGSQKTAFEKERLRKEEQLIELQKIQDFTVAHAQRELLVRKELTNAQEELSKKTDELARLQQGFSDLENERTKLKIILLSKERKIEQKERQIQTTQHSSSIQPYMQSPMQPRMEAQTIEPLRPVVDRSRRHSKRHFDKAAFVTHLQQEKDPYERFELSNKDTAWRQKCEQLYLQNKRLVAELERVQQERDRPREIRREGQSLNMRKTEERRFNNISFKYNILKQNQPGPLFLD